MARPAEIDIKQVTQACEELDQLGQRPTIKRVRGIIGKGSETTIGRLLKEYFTNKEKENKLSEYKVEVTDDVMALFKKLLFESQRTMVTREGELQTKITELQEQIQSLTEENTKYADDLERLKDSHQSTRITHEITLSENNDLKSRANALQNEYLMAKEQNVKLQVEIGKLETKIEMLEKQSK